MMLVVRCFLSAEEHGGALNCSDVKGRAAPCCMWRESEWMPAFRMCLGVHFAWIVLLFIHMRLMLVLEFIMSW